jgi:hypothetical protein
MSTVKRTAGDYNLITVDGSVYVNTQNFTIDGNLIVRNSIANVDAINNYVYQDFITLVAGQPGGPIIDAGLYVDRGAPNPPAGLRWHEAESTWQVNDTTGWKNLSGTVIYQDKNPKLGANLDVNGYSIWDSQHNTVTFDSIIKIEQLTSNADPVAGYSIIYAKAAADGDTGVYVSNEKKIGEELITKKKAFLYSLIL